MDCVEVIEGLLVGSFYYILFIDSGGGSDDDVCVIIDILGDVDVGFDQIENWEVFCLLFEVLFEWE